MSQATTLFYASLNTPVGEIFFAKSRRGLVRVSYLDSHQQVNDELRLLSERLNAELVDDISQLMDITFQLIQYFDGGLREFTLPLDLSLVSGFQREVLEHVREIPYGETASYRELAIRAGRPNAYRASGTACGNNPLVLVIPCHRIIKADGSIGDYGSAGRERKQFLLDLEAKQLLSS